MQALLEIKYKMLIYLLKKPLDLNLHSYDEFCKLISNKHNMQLRLRQDIIQ